MGMTVNELIDYLQEQDPDAPVRIGDDYGDLVHTCKVEEIEAVREMNVYHRGAYGTYNIDDGDADETHPCVILFTEKGVDAAEDYF